MLDGLNSRPEHVKEVAEGSLKRLRTDRIDLLYQHRVDPERADRGRRGGGEGADPGGQGQALRPLRSRERRRSVARTPSSRSPRSRASTRCGGESPEAEILPTLEELGIGFVPFSPLGKGFLTGKIDESTTFDSSDFRNIVPRFTPEARKANQALVDLLASVAERKKATPAQIALAWLLAQKPWIVPIPGTTKLAPPRGEPRSATVELTPDDLREIESAASTIKVQGARYPEQAERMTGL